MSDTSVIHVLNGPNLNLLGVREPEIYGRDTLADIEQRCVTAAGEAQIVFRQTILEGVLVDWIVDLAQHNGYLAQATSVAGVAPRTGATIYYIELFAQRHAEARGAQPVLAQLSAVVTMQTSPLVQSASLSQPAGSTGVDAQKPPVPQSMGSHAGSAGSHAGRPQSTSSQRSPAAQSASVWHDAGGGDDATQVPGPQSSSWQLASPGLQTGQEGSAQRASAGHSRSLVQGCASGGGVCAVAATGVSRAVRPTRRDARCFIGFSGG
jgi:hypothetical protein